MTPLVTLVVVFFVANVRETLSAPAVTYDQQQSGDLNVRVDLNDIQIIALLGGDMFDGFGDYDYSYDYSDFTIKPLPGQSTTPAPYSPTSSSVKPWHTWPTIAPSPAPTTVVSENAEAKPSEEQSSTIDSSLELEPEKNASSTSTAPAAAAEIINSSVETPASSSPALPEPEAISSPETAALSANDKTGPAADVENEKEAAASAAPQTASPEKNPASATVQENSEALTDQTQSQSVRKCNPGSTRDQEGRCRRVHTRRRVPSSFLPFGIRLIPKIHNQLRDQQSGTVEN